MYMLKGEYIHYNISFAYLILLSVNGNEHVPWVIKSLSSKFSLKYSHMSDPILQNACTISDTACDIKNKWRWEIKKTIYR